MTPTPPLRQHRRRDRLHPQLQWAMDLLTVGDLKQHAYAMRGAEDLTRREAEDLAWASMKVEFARNKARPK
jgi:hypothetical protein